MTAFRYWLWGLAAVAFVPITVFAANGTIILLGLIALAAPGLLAWRGAVYDLARSRMGWALGGLLALAVLSLIWSPGPQVAADKLFRLFVLWAYACAAVAAVQAADRKILKWFARLLPLGIGLAVLFYLAELVTSAAIITAATGLREVMQSRFATPAEQEYFRLVYGFGSINRGAGLLTFFVWPAMLCLVALYPTKGKWLAVILGFAVFAVILPLPMQAAPMAMAVGAIAFGFTWITPHRAPHIMAVMVMVLVAAMPFISWHVSRPEVVGIEKRQLPGSWQHRVEIWHFAAEKIAAKPLLGWGFDASRNLGAGTEQFVLVQPDGAEVRFAGVGLLPLHPHNGILQIWLEMGALGAALLMLLLYGLGECLTAIARDYGRLGGAIAAASAASALCVGLLSFGQWQSWWQASLWIAAVLCLGALRVLNPHPR